ncbi:MAG: DUF6125 family protein [Candidatus Hodarchaeales archaeon]|jgi:hypothetical protein
MRKFDDISKIELKELLCKNWMTHDAMWFSHCVQNIGIEKTNKINKAAVRSMSLIEIKRIKKILQIDTIESFEQFRKFLITAFEVIKGDFMKFKMSFPKTNAIHAEMRDCFAYQGVKRIGAIANYECGIFERIEGWFDGLGIKYNVVPDLNGCLMHQRQECIRDYTVSMG